MDDSTIISSVRVTLLTILLAFWIYVYAQSRQKDESNKVFGEENGCQPIQKRLLFKWPLALTSSNGNTMFYMGKTFQVKLLGKVGYFTTDPRNLEAILLTRFEDFELGSRRQGLFPMIGEGIFTQDGHPWKHSREILRRQFVRIQYQDLKVFESPINDLLDGLMSSSGIVDLQPFFFRFTLATTTSLIFGEPFAGLDSTDHEIFSKNFDYCSLTSAMRLRLADWCWIYSPWKFKKSCQMVKRYATHYVNHAPKDKDENGEEAASERHPFILDLYKELQDPVVVHYLLVRHPVALERLRQEIRLYTQIPVNVRVASKTTFIPRGGGPDGLSPLLLTKGTGIGFSPYHMHRHKDLYGDDANEFRPERWEGPELKSIGWGFMPFHGGPRICLGKDFALTEASYGIVRILQCFPCLHLPPGHSTEPSGLVKQDLTLVVSSAEGCKVMLS
ncbi:Cytochrome P450 [Venustampulla echinocandica]|uniref:Cytochrome P450 n=1 Tax=Venustampulla echinocandica TaxID=2656787 RepID=A0A370TDV9_9HELO|nr:Cytochrome P450 [Venustampulla echinocandica]RDL32646.1 Cytochrome P450 [Venustampulla echinocandica]